QHHRLQQGNRSRARPHRADREAPRYQYESDRIATLRCSPAGTSQALLQVVGHRLEARLSAFLILIRSTAADADSADLSLAPRHDRQAAGECYNAGNICDAGRHTGFAVRTEGHLADAPGGEREVGCSDRLLLRDVDAA